MQELEQIERALERLIACQFAKAELNEASHKVVCFAENGEEIPMKQVYDSSPEAVSESGMGTRPIRIGVGHYAQMHIEGPLRNSKVLDAAIAIYAPDWEMRAQAWGTKRGQDPNKIAIERLIVTDATKRFVEGIPA